MNPVAPTFSWPAAAGFRLPAEWDPQAGTWVSWPHQPSTWPDCREDLLRDYALLVAAISRFQPVFINHPSPAVEEEARRLLERAEAAPENLFFFDHPTDDAWCRDHGPLFVRHQETGEIALTDWEYNAWGGKFPSALDNLIPRQIASSLGMRRFSLPYILEGGSLETDGRGHLLTTESVLLNPNRNQGLSRTQIEEILCQGLGVDRILWLGIGLEGDDTDGHIDDLTRFTPGGEILTVVETNPGDTNYRALQENLEALHQLRDKAGKSWPVRTLPMPEPVYNDGERLPASYANYLIVNGAVLVPSFAQSDRDTEAQNILGRAFPDRQIVPVDSRLFVREAGAVHCLTQHQPAGPFAPAGQSL